MMAINMRIKAALLVATFIVVSGCQNSEPGQIVAADRDITQAIGSNARGLCELARNVSTTLNEGHSGRQITIEKVGPLNIEKVVKPDERFGNMILSRITENLKWNGLSIRYVDYFAVAESDWIDTTIYFSDRPEKVKTTLASNGADKKIGNFQIYSQEKADPAMGSGGVIYSGIQVSGANDSFPAGSNSAITCSDVDEQGEAIGI